MLSSLSLWMSTPRPFLSSLGQNLMFNNPDNWPELPIPKDSEIVPPFWLDTHSRLGLPSPFSSNLLQYIDDLPLFSPYLSDRQPDTTSLLNFLGSRGYQLSPSKVKFFSPQVTSLGFSLTPTQKHITLDNLTHLHTNHQPQPVTDSPSHCWQDPPQSPMFLKCFSFRTYMISPGKTLWCNKKLPT